MGKDTRLLWLEKLDYIQAFNPVAPGENFEDNRSTFADYCNDQANACDCDGFSRIAEMFRLVRDMASPNYRSIAGGEGRIVVGTYVTTNTRERLFPSTPDIARFGP